jgi:hypothetical protein
VPGQVVRRPFSDIQAAEALDLFEQCGCALLVRALELFQQLVLELLQLLRLHGARLQRRGAAARLGEKR